MQFNSFSDFINMGGYGFYVWLSFGAAALILTLLLISSKAGHQKIITQIVKRKQREDKLRQAKELRKKQNEALNEVTE
ncbi:heme exporter protein CcmD [Colwellia sp. 12G3]|uniref:heme exporter protein CcmD n=1 Tax=Colwellia sp. 12G3 TaxID=2058299 RepID=UPI000C3336A7|nr:heme exporter protein CcmD [Colwellia sp. 12G3]PKI14140.1 heme exporter protein CcmD [Colwellia sp. 12G3]